MIKYGDIIEYSTFTGQSRIVRVSCKLDDVKYGEPGFDAVTQVFNSATGRYEDSPGPFHSVWGYDDQIVRVIQPA